MELTACYQSLKEVLEGYQKFFREKIKPEEGEVEYSEDDLRWLLYSGELAQYGIPRKVGGGSFSIYGVYNESLKGILLPTNYIIRSYGNIGHLLKLFHDARMMIRYAHPNFISFDRIFFTPTLAGFIVPHYGNKSLNNLMSNRGIGLGPILGIILQLATLLRHMEVLDSGTYTDLSLNNVIIISKEYLEKELDYTGNTNTIFIKLIDPSSAGKYNERRSPEITISYAAPVMIMTPEGQHVNSLVMVYSLGLILLALLTGKRTGRMERKQNAYKYKDLLMKEMDKWIEKEGTDIYYMIKYLANKCFRPIRPERKQKPRIRLVELISNIVSILQLMGEYNVLNDISEFYSKSGRWDAFDIIREATQEKFKEEYLTEFDEWKISQRGGDTETEDATVTIGEPDETVTIESKPGSVQVTRSDTTTVNTDVSEMPIRKEKALDLDIDSIRKSLTREEYIRWTRENLDIEDVLWKKETEGLPIAWLYDNIYSKEGLSDIDRQNVEAGLEKYKQYGGVQKVMKSMAHQIKKRYLDNLGRLTKQDKQIFDKFSKLVNQDKKLYDMYCFHMYASQIR